MSVSCRFCCRSPLKTSANNDSLTLTRSAAGMGHDWLVGAGSRAAVFFVLPLRGGARRSPGARDCSSARSILGLWRAFAPLSGARPPLGRSSSDDPDANPRLRLRPALGAIALSRGQGQSGVPLVLRLEHRRQDSGPFGVLASPQ